MSQLTPQTRRQGPSFSMVFFGVGLAFGVVAYVTYLRPEMRVNQEFVEATCTVVEKRLVIMQDRNGVVYRPEFLIRYRVGERQYETRTYDITSASTSGRASKEEILSKFTVGERYSCWYDPLNPQVAVLVRGYTAFAFVLVGFGVLLMLIGLVGMV